jgi:hypothetical protein
MSIRDRHGRISRQVHQAAFQKICNHLWCSEDLQTIAADDLGIRVSPEPGDAAPGICHAVAVMSALSRRRVEEAPNKRVKNETRAINRVCGFLTRSLICLSECHMHPQKSVSMMTKRDLTAGTKCHTRRVMH